MKLLFSFPEPLPLPRARGVQVAHSAASLADAGVMVDLAYAPVSGCSPLDPIGMEPPAGLAFVPISRGWPAPLDRVPPFSRWHSVRFFAHRLRGEIGKRRPDALYVRHLKLASLLLASQSLPPMVYEAHEIFADTVKPALKEHTAAMESAVMAGAAAVVCNSQATANRLIALYGAPSRLLVLPNGVTPPAKLPEKPWAECRRHVVYAGSFFGWKGVDDLVAAAADLPGFRITLIGGEPAQIERLRRQAPQQGAELEFLPRCPNPEVMDRLAASCIAVLPNRPDPDSTFTSPIKLFEYMAAGCAIVCADLPPMREILGSGDAAWFESGNARSLADTVRSLGLNCEQARDMGQRLREMSAAYTWQQRAQRLKAFIAETVESSR